MGVVGPICTEYVYFDAANGPPDNRAVLIRRWLSTSGTNRRVLFVIQGEGTLEGKLCMPDSKVPITPSEARSSDMSRASDC